MDSSVQRKTAPLVQQKEHREVFEWLVLPRQALRVTWASFYIWHTGECPPVVKR
jgi:hypothetical protein